MVPPSQAKPSAAVRSDATAGLTVHIADLSSPNLDEYRHHFTGAHAVIHLGFGGAMGTEASLTGPKWDSEYANVGMAHNVYQVSLESVPSHPHPLLPRPTRVMVIPRGPLTLRPLLAFFRQCGA